MKVLLASCLTTLSGLLFLLALPVSSAFLVGQSSLASPPSTNPITKRSNQDVLRLEARRRNRSSEEEHNKSTVIPQLPSFGTSSFDATEAAKRRFSAEEQQAAAPSSSGPAFVGSKFQLSYTCKVCETRNVHKVSRIAYNKGVVITICKGCMSHHLISDHLGFTQKFDGNLEDYLKDQGSEESVHRVSEDVFNLETTLGLDTKSGSILGPDGSVHLE